MQYVNQSICTVSSTPQSNVEQWKKERYGHVTGTTWNGILRFARTEEQKQELANKKCGIIPDEIPEENMKYVRYGIDNEDKLRKILETLLGEEIYELGFAKSLIYPIFGCSVDGILNFSQ